MAEPEDVFDFKTHEQAAVTAYLKCYGFYENLASIVKRILEEALKRKDIKVHSVQARAKEPASFGKKATQPSEADPTKPKYLQPLEQITDLDSGSQDSPEGQIGSRDSGTPISHR